MVNAPAVPAPATSADGNGVGIAVSTATMRAFPNREPKRIVSAVLDEAHANAQGDTDRNRRGPANAACGHCSAEEHRVDGDNANGDRHRGARGNSVPRRAARRDRRPAPRRRARARRVRRRGPGARRRRRGGCTCAEVLTTFERQGRFDTRIRSSYAPSDATTDEKMLCRCFVNFIREAEIAVQENATRPAEGHAGKHR